MVYPLMQVLNRKLLIYRGIYFTDLLLFFNYFGAKFINVLSNFVGQFRFLKLQLLILPKSTSSNGYPNDKSEKSAEIFFEMFLHEDLFPQTNFIICKTSCHVHLPRLISD